MPGVIPERALQRQVGHLVEDLRQQVARDAGLRAELRQEYEDAEKARRVAGGFETWLEGVLDQAAVAWVLSCVFVRFCEDNGLAGRFLHRPDRHRAGRARYRPRHPRHHPRVRGPSRGRHQQFADGRLCGRDALDASGSNRQPHRG
jgi:hypothetical protein